MIKTSMEKSEKLARIDLSCIRDSDSWFRGKWLFCMTAITEVEVGKKTTETYLMNRFKLYICTILVKYELEEHSNS